MFTQRLVLLCLLVAVSGGCSIWYTTKILPASVPPATDATPVTVHDQVKPVKVVPKPNVSVSAKPSTLDQVSDAIGATALADDLAAIAVSADTMYDDSVLNVEVTNSEPASLTTAYGI